MLADQAASLGYVKQHLLPFIDYETGIVFDTMHFRVRTFDKMISDIVRRCLSQTADGERTRNAFTRHAREDCGNVRIDFHTVQDASAKKSYLTMSPSLNGVMAKKLQRGLKLELFFQGKMLKTMRIVFALYDRLVIALHVPQDHPLYLQPDNFQTVATSFAYMYTFAMDCSFTPYLHSLVAHAADLLRRHTTIYDLNCQASEHEHLINKEFIREHTMANNTLDTLVKLGEHLQRMYQLFLRPELVLENRTYDSSKRAPAHVEEWSLNDATLPTLQNLANLVNEIDSEIGGFLPKADPAEVAARAERFAMVMDSIGPLMAALGYATPAAEATAPAPAAAGPTAAAPSVEPPATEMDVDGPLPLATLTAEPPPPPPPNTSPATFVSENYHMADESSIESAFGMAQQVQPPAGDRQRKRPRP